MLASRVGRLKKNLAAGLFLMVLLHLVVNSVAVSQKRNGSSKTDRGIASTKGPNAFEGDADKPASTGRRRDGLYTTCPNFFDQTCDLDCKCCKEMRCRARGDTPVNGDICTWDVTVVNAHTGEKGICRSMYGE